MTDFDHDVLTRIAFGEEEPGDREHFAELLTRHPEAQRELEDMQMLCGDLGVLARVPEPQISFARVRQAIESGKQPRRAFPFWTVMVGLAGAAAAFVLFSTLSKPATVAVNAPETVATREAAPSASAPVIVDVPAENFDSLVTDIMSTDAEPVSKAETFASVRPRVTRKAAKPVVRRKPVLMRQTMAALAAAPTLPEAEPQSSHPIVVVTSRPDPETGAARAFESPDSSNIEFRG